MSKVPKASRVTFARSRSSRILPIYLFTSVQAMPGSTTLASTVANTRRTS
jgi:hypothetical protein